MNTNLPCPICGRTTTPSSIGNVCVACEKVWPRSTMTYTPSLTSQLEPEPPASQPADLNQRPASIAPDRHEPYPAIRPSYLIQHAVVDEQDAAEMQAGYEYSLRSRLKRLVIPELPSALDESRSLDSPDVDAIAAHPFADTPPLHETTAALTMIGSLPSSQTEESAKVTPEPAQPTPGLSSAPTAPETENPLEEGRSPQEPAKAELPLNQAVGSEASQDPIESSESQWVLFSTIGVIIVVIAIGAWLTTRNRATPARIKTTATPQTATQPTTGQKQSVSADATKRDAQRKKDLHDIATALEVYKQQQGSYPVGEDIAVLYPLQYTTPPYISFVNYDPLSTADKKIKYAYSSNGNSFTLQAKLENTTDSEAISGYYTLKSK